ncbi:DNA-processing protein DprA [Brevibacillus migulae]|uniref:DNA-processing protein DprA n=1 Tax=Brevibacillus migulae TaxID=1644114 RepID=UPI00106E57A4|nr:DNA-processing protein DprA [Brevibacillus migulae]
MGKWSGLEERDWLYSLSKIPGLGRKSIIMLYEQRKSFSAISELCRNSDLQEFPFSDKIRQLVGKHLTPEQVEKDKVERSNGSVSFITILDREYPEWLRQIPDPPLILYYRGNLAYLHQPIIAIVGSRKPTVYGKDTCAAISKQLAEAGMVIASGMAYGVDAEAHRTALRMGAPTIGVLGCGIDQIYPSMHRTLYQEVEEKGLLLSEYPPGAPPVPGYFPERNRIISGLSLGVVVVEAAVKSGSLITAQFALEQGREVFAVPGPVFSQLSAGPHNLIKEGAKLVTGWQDIYEEIAHMIPGAAQDPVSEEAPVSLSPSESALLERIGYDPILWDELFASLESSMRRTIDVDLIQLEGKGYIASMPGGFYTRRK